MTKDRRVTLEGLGNFALDLIRAAGDKALTYYGRGRSAAEFDQNLVTQAELELSSFLTASINERFPDHQVFGQDSTPEAYAHDDKRYLWILDPLDGVDNFQSGIPIWGLSIALLENFWPVFGAFFMPVTGDLFYAMAGQSAFWGQRTIRIVSRPSLTEESLLFTFSRFHQAYSSSFPGKIRDMGSTGAHACYVAMGRADGALVTNESIKDLAAVRVIVEAAGGRFFTTTGSDFHLNEYLDGRRIQEHVLIAGAENSELILNSLVLR